MSSGRVLTKELDARLKSVEERIADIVGHLGLLDEQMRQAGHHAHPVTNAIPAYSSEANGHNGEGNGHNGSSDRGAGSKVAELEASIARLDQRVDKIASTLVTQSSRWS